MDPVSAPSLFPAIARTFPTGPEDDGEQRAVAASDFSSFLRLLTAQLRNQDPLQPLDSTEFVAQLASFSTVEQLIATNERLDGLASQAEAQSSASLASWIGREASLTTGSFVGDGTERGFEVPAVDGATTAVAKIRRPDGVTLHEIQVDPTGAEHLSWDGRAEDGTIVLGPHTLEIDYFLGEELIAQRPARLFQEITGLVGTDDGVSIEFADGSLAAPDEVSALRLVSQSAPEESGERAEDPPQSGAEQEDTRDPDVIRLERLLAEGENNSAGLPVLRAVNHP